MLDNKVRFTLEKISRPTIAIFSKYGIHPLHLTVSGFVLAITTGFFISIGYYKTALCLWWLSRLCDGFDGILARATNTTSAIGAYLDITCDMAAYSFIIICFALKIPEFSMTGLVILFLYILCITTALSAGTLIENFRKKSDRPQFQKDNRGAKLAAGLAEGGETGFVYTLMLLYTEHIHYIAYVWICVLITTVISRTIYLYRQIPTG